MWQSRAGDGNRAPVRGGEDVLLPYSHPKRESSCLSVAPFSAAIVAAIERFMRATAPANSQSANGDPPDGWQRAALLEGTSRTSHDEDVAWMSPAPG